MILSGVLYNAGGPVSNARIIFTANKTSLNGVLKGAYKEFETQEDGTYFLDLEPGYYYVAWYPSQGPLVRLGAVTADDVTMATLPAALSAEGQPVNPDIVTDEVQDALNQIQILRDETEGFATDAAASAASLNAADIVHAPLSGLDNEAGTAYSRDVGTGATELPTNADLGDLAQIDTLSNAPVGDAEVLQTALGVVNVADRGVAGGDENSNLASQPYVDTGLAEKVDVGQVGFESIDTSTGTQTVAGALDRRAIVFDSVAAMQAFAGLQVGAKVRTLGYYAPGDGGGNDYEIVAAGTGTDDGGSFIDLSGNGLQARGLFSSGRNLLQFGAVADGDYQGGGTDNTDVIQRVYDYLESDGKLQSVTAMNKGTGCYRVDGPIYGRKNTLFLFDEGATFDFQSSAMPSNAAESDGLWEFKGAWSGSEIPISANLTTGDTTVTTTTAHGLSAGDKFLIKGQRNSLHSDAGDWRLGRATGSVDAHALYFGEPCIVDQVVSATEVVVRNPLIFPDYRTDDTLETSPAANRPATTIQKMDLLPGAKIIGGEFLVGANGLFYVELCDEPSVLRTKVFHSGTPGICYLSKYNYRAKFLDVYAEHPEDNYLVEPHAKYNSFKSKSDWHTEWGYTDINGMQGLDGTYEIGGVPTLYLNVSKVRSINSIENGITLHSGVYDYTIDDVQITGNRQPGIFIRSRQGSLSNYKVSTTHDTAGLWLSEWASDLELSVGTLDVGGDGFFIGMHSILPGDSEEQWLARRNINISSLGIKARGRIGRIWVVGDNSINTAENSGITLSGITVSDHNSPLSINSYVNAVTVRGLTSFSSAGSDAVSTQNNSVMNTFDNIKCLGGGRSVVLGSKFDSATFPYESFPSNATGDVIRDCTDEGFGAGVAVNDSIKFLFTTNYTINNVAVRERIIAGSSSSLINLRLPVANSSGVQSVPVGASVLVVNDGSADIGVVALPGVIVDTSIYGSSNIPPGSSGEVVCVSNTRWLLR